MSEISLQYNSASFQPSFPTPEWEFITKEDAARLMAIEEENRDIKRSVVKEYRRVMNSGMWRLSPHGICIGPNGGVSDGAHRLTALAESDLRGIWFLVCRWGVSAKDLRVDRGSKRTLADFAGLAPHEAAPFNSIASILNVGNGNRRDPTEMEPILTAFQAPLSALLEACPSQIRGRTQGSVRAGMAIAMAVSSPSISIEIADAYRRFVMDQDGCWPSMRSLRIQVDRVKMDTLEIIAKAYKAAANRDLQKLIYSDDMIADCRQAARLALRGSVPS